MHINIILEHNFKTTYKNFSITHDDSWRRRATFGNGAYVFRIEELRKIMDEIKYIMIHGLFNQNMVMENEVCVLTECNEQKNFDTNEKYICNENTHNYDEEKHNHHFSINQIIKIGDNELKLKDIVSDKIYISKVKFKKECAYVGAGMCPHYTKIMTENFPIIEEITNYKIELYDYYYEEKDNKIILIDEDIMEYQLGDTNDDVKEKLKSSDQIKVLKCYNNKNKINSLLLVKIIEIINKDV